MALADCAVNVQGSVPWHACQRTELPPFRFQQVLNNPSPDSSSTSA